MLSSLITYFNVNNVNIKIYTMIAIVCHILRFIIQLHFPPNFPEMLDGRAIFPVKYKTENQNSIKYLRSLYLSPASVNDQLLIKIITPIHELRRYSLLQKKIWLKCNVWPTHSTHQHGSLTTALIISTFSYRRGPIGHCSCSTLL